ncbi:MAG: glutathione S-transferase family protein [Proteobacteria bacterium]|nr:glutathione S-transferase family protein [Pseudomonadota bacterium]
MSAPYRIFGIELSPYSVKVRSYFRYKQIPHEWVVRNMGNMAEFQKLAKLPLIPLVVAPDGGAMQDSTPILEKMEAAFPEPSIHPADPVLAFLSALLEEYGDEWGNKHMFHYRWWYEPDQQSAARRIAEANLPEAPAEAVDQMTNALVERMVPRLSFVGSSATTKDQIEASLARQIDLVDAHLAGRKYLFGDRPALADFGLWGQLYNAWTDPTPAALMKGRDHLLAWIERMLEPVAEGDFESAEAIVPTLEPLLAEDVAALFLPWSTANAVALAEGKGEFSVELEGRTFTQQTQKYHAKSLKALKARYAAVAESDRAALDPILERTGCLRWLQP